MVASPHGDSADILTPLNLTAPMLIDAYRVTVFAGMGPGDLDAALADVIVEYVAGGESAIIIIYLKLYHVPICVACYFKHSICFL